MGPEILDGRGLAARRLPSLRQRAAAVAARRGYPPCLVLVAFPAPDGSVPHVRGKVRACADAGVAAVLLVPDPADDTAAVLAHVDHAVATHAPDGVFVQVPIPPHLDEGAITRAIPPAVDVDIMTDAAFAAYMSGECDAPPVTVAGALHLLDAHAIDVRGLHGVVAAGTSPFALMFAEALRRRGADVGPILEPGAPDWDHRLGTAQLVVAALGRPGAVPAAGIAPAAVVLDIGYFNPGARGDVDASTGIGHLQALMPVPGGVGPMTISALVERVVAFAEAPPARTDQPATGR